MPYSSGTFSRIYNWVNEQLSSPIEISKLDAQEEDFATAFNNALLRDGTGLPTAAMDWNGQNLTNVAAFTATGIVTGGRFVPTSSSVPTNGMYLSAANTLAFSSNTTLRWSVNSTGTHTLAAPSSGTTLVVPGLTGTAAAYIGVLGATNNPRVEITGTEASALAQIDFTGSTGSAAGRISRAGTAVIDISAARNVTVNAPSSGITLQVNSSGTGANAFVSRLLGGTNNPGLFVSHNESTRVTLLDASGSTSGVMALGTSGTARQTINENGNVTINAPSSGTALTVGGATGTYIGFFNGANAASSYIRIANGGTTVADLGSAAAVISGGASADLGLSANTGAGLALGTNGGASRLAIGSAGNVTINAPSSGTAFSVTGASGLLAANFQGAAADSVRVEVTRGGGTAGTDSFALIQDTSSVARLFNRANAAMDFSTNGTQRVNIAAGGAVTINAPSSGTALTVSGTVAATAVTGDGSGLTSLAAANLTGTVNTARISGSYTGITAIGNATALDDAAAAQTLGWRDMPQNASSSVTLALSDRGKHVYASGTTSTVAIPANGSVAFPVGSTIVLVNDGTGNMTVSITTDTLAWLTGGTESTGTRTVATKSVVTLVKVTSTRWIITGAGIS